MECSGESVIYAHVRADSSPESAGELRATVRDDVIWYAMFADHVLEEHPCQLRLVDMFPAEQVNRHLSQSVDNYQNPGNAQCHWLGQVRDKNHCDSLPRTIR